MGKSAKLYKRTHKKSSLSGTSGPPNTSVNTSTQSQAKKKTTLKAKATKGRAGSAKEGILGGADYVALMMGGRKRAREEAKKLPQDEP